MFRFCYTIVLILLLFGCQTMDKQEQQDVTALFDEEQLDAMFDRFEIQADESPELYLSNPDSFVNSIPGIPQTPIQKSLYANGLVLMAYALVQHGNIYEGIKYYEKALNYIEQHDIQEIEKNVSIIRPLANLYVRIGDNQKAITLLEEHIPHIEDSELNTSFLIALANAHLFHGTGHQAKDILSEVSRTSPNSLSRARAYNILSDIHKEEDDTTNFIRYNELAIREFEKSTLEGEAIHWYASALAVKGESENNNRTVDQALQLIHQHAPHSQHRPKAKLTVMNGDLYLKKQDWPSAISQYKTAIRLLGQDEQPYTLDYTYTRALFGIAQCYEEDANIDSALHYYQWAIENDFRTQQLIRGKSDQLKNNRWHRQMVERMVDLMAKRLTQPHSDEQKLIEQLLWCIELSKARLLINEINRSELWESSSMETKQAIQHIRNLYTQQDQSDSPEEKKQLQDHIDRLLVDFQLSERYFETIDFNPTQEDFLAHLNRPQTDYYAYFVHRDKQISIVSKVNGHYRYDRIADTVFTDEIHQLKNNYFGDSPEAYRNSPNQYRSQSQHIAQKLLPNTGNHNTNIYASLDGDLYGLPLDALWDGDFLVNRYNFAYLNSFLLFDFLPSKSSTKNQIALLYRSAYPEPLPNLDFVPKEITSISNAFQTRPVPPEQQLDTVISEVFSAPDIVHIAAHTLIHTEDQAPLIYLEHMISTNQIRFYHMNAPLVFLSACNTGSGSALPAEGMESIQRVFLSKGVPSVISTYWFANDEAMLQLTADFYQQLAQSKQPVTALAHAKRNYLEKADSEQQNPWYWANINYTGVGNEIGLKKSSSLSTFIRGFLLLSLIGFAYFLWRKSRSNRSLIKIDQEPHH